MRNTGLEETQAGIKIARKNINNLRYADDTSLMAESEEELKSLLMKVEKLALSSTFRKRRSWHLVPSLHGKWMGKWWEQYQTLFSWAPKSLQNHCDHSHEIKRCLFLGRKAMTNIDNVLKSRDITLLTKVWLVKAMVFPVVMYECESWIIKKAEH